MAKAAGPSVSSQSFVCLQNAMWILAAALDPHADSYFSGNESALYEYTRASLEDEAVRTVEETTPIELAQAWILLAIYEITKVDYSRGQGTVSRCIKLVMSMRLHKIDNSQAATMSPLLSWSEAEERRRTFWAAYMLDCVCGFVSEVPLATTREAVGHPFRANRNID